jgi:hypothetical protein
LNGTPTAVAVSDINSENGIPDAEIGTGGGTEVLLGVGDGIFRSPTSAGKAAVFSLTVADFNHDGKIDVAVSGYFGSVTVFPGCGGRTFGSGVVVSTGSTIGAGLAVGDVNQGNLAFAPEALHGAGHSPVVIRRGDFNHDGKPDL